MNASISILLVEDNPGDQIIVTKYLTKSQTPDFNVTVCSNLAEAKEALTVSNFDTILLDLTLPDSDGLKTFHNLNRIAPLTPIIILTGLDVRELAIQAVREGAQDYLVKGEHLKILLARAIQHGIERKHRLSQEIELAKTQAHMQAMQTFMQDITHDLKTPLSVIMTSGELLSRYVSLDNPKIVRHLKNIIDQSDRLKHMINSIMEMSELTLLNEIADDDLVAVNLHIILDKLEESLADLAATNRVQLQCNMLQSPINLHADESMITRLLNNLVHNAITHTPPDGQVRVEISEENTQAVIKVTDTGVGIPPESLEHVFDRFYRVDKTRESETGNSGLGLAIVKRIVELHHGQIQVDSKVNHGTQFTVTLPMITNKVAV